MAKEVDLLSYWMPVLRQLKEFKEIAKAEEPELRYILEACDRTLNNFFISTADEYGISRFESMMGIFPYEGEDLETRRFNVLVKWNDKVPYTDGELYDRLLSLCGEGKFTITPQYEDYKISITTEAGIKGAFDTISSLITDMLPCNLELTLQNILKAQKDTATSFGVAISTAMSYQITNDINKQYTADNPLTFGMGVGKAGTHTVTHDIAVKVAKDTPLNEAVAVANAFSEIITHDVGLTDNLEAPLNNAIGVGMAHTTLITHDLESKADVNGNSTVGTPVSTATVITIN